MPTEEPTAEPTEEPTPAPTPEPGQPEGTIMGLVTASVLAIREAPDGSAKVIGNWHQDQIVYIYYQEGEYYYLNVGGTDVYGYGSVNFIVPESLVPMKGGPTAEPTEEPTAAPTDEPTPVPTDEPTPEPTEVPTEEPTAEPTPEPTLEPEQPEGTILGFITSNVLAIREAPNGTAKVIGNWYMDQVVYIYYQERVLLPERGRDGRIWLRFCEVHRSGEPGASEV